MLSFASAAFGADGTLVGTYTANLEALPEAVRDPDTMAWWAKNPGLAGVPVRVTRCGDERIPYVAMRRAARSADGPLGEGGCDRPDATYRRDPVRPWEETEAVALEKCCGEGLWITSSDVSRSGSEWL
ncbi:hypothetical protein SAMN06264365_101865 [Actinoplanes regularis]|uniref:Uncharacterized protein n=1 Tax=Actinoplanes regularis TaxID=52697 RepID=A0A238V8D7_9ACTN|nr:hypothetical protein Are01nite_02060 [Actinoplanes regularis]SNR30712.1 hypothetical protein SAMN06264365_101865 [Actinoplanes regularis]